MPELGDLMPWDEVSWDNMALSSGTGPLDRRPYYFKVVDVGRETKVLLISAVPSRTQGEGLHATDYLRLDRYGFKRLMEVGGKIFGTLSKQ